MTGDLQAVATWHADKAVAHYYKGEMDDYCRHIVIADRLRRDVWIKDHASPAKRSAA